MNPTIERLIQRSTNLDKFEDALDACMEFLTEYPDHPYFTHFQITDSIINTYLSNALLNSGDFPKLTNPNAYQSNRNKMEVFSSELPSALINGLVLDPKISNKEKRESLIKVFNLFRNVAANELYKVFHKSEEEAKSFLIDGQIRAYVEKKTNDELLKDAKIYYEALTENDYDGAIKGFDYLKSLNPTIPYYRLALGTALSNKGDNFGGLKEFLYGLYLNPGDPQMTANLMIELSVLDLHFLILDVWLDYKKHNRANEDKQADQSIQKMVNVSKTCTIGLLSCMSKGSLTESDISKESISIFEDMSASVRPWYSDK